MNESIHILLHFKIFNHFFHSFFTFYRLFFDERIRVNFINTLFRPYKEEMKEESVVRSCSSSGEITDLLIHQKLVRDYLTYYTPYRGLLFYHGLGSGKTCASIATAESLKTMKKIIKKIINKMIKKIIKKTNYREQYKDYN